MRLPLVISVTSHVVLGAVLWFGLPEIRRHDVVQESMILVNVVEVAERTQAPTPPQRKPEPPPEKPKPAPKPEAEVKPPPPPAKPEPKKAPPPPPKREAQVAMAPTPPPKSEPKPAPEPKPQKAAVPPPTPKPKPKRKPPPKPEPVKQKKPPEPKPPPKKPAKKQDDFLNDMASVLKNLAAKQPPPPPDASPRAEAQPARAPGAIAPPGTRLTISEEDAIRRHVERYWNLNFGAKNVQDMSVELRILVRSDGSIIRVSQQEGSHSPSDPAFRAFVESARRAVLRADPLPIPTGKYALFEDGIVMNFSPRDMNIY